MAPCILSMGYEPHLMTIRTALLRGAGYVVDEAYERTAALSRALCDSVDVLLICHTVPKPERRWLITHVREKRKLMPILYLITGIHQGSRDGSIGVENDPEELLNALGQAIKLSETLGTAS